MNDDGAILTVYFFIRYRGIYLYFIAILVVKFTCSTRVVGLDFNLTNESM